MKHNAVVLGGSVAGLLAAAALAPRYDTIEIIERDVLPAGPQARRGAPQGRHVHAMLPRGLQAIEGLLPGITERLEAAGGMRGDVLGNARWHLNGRTLRRRDIGLAAITASRALIEATIRAAVRELPNVTITDGHDIVGFAAGRAVRITGRHGQGSRVVPATLVVDATGRGSRMPQWLVALGGAAAPRDEVPIDLRYASRVFEGDLLGDALVVVTARYPGQRRSSVMQRLEGGRVLVTLAGVHGERPPGDPAGFAAYADTLAVADTAKVIAEGRPVGDAVPFHFPAYVRHRYDQAELPPGVVVIGDAACAFNPVYGQGMSVAAMSAELLREDDDPRRFHAGQARLQEAPWTLAVGADLALDGPPATGPSAGPATGPSTGPAAGPATGPSTGPAAGPATGPSTGSAAGPATGPSTGSATGSATGPATGPSTGPTTGPAAGPAAMLRALQLAAVEDADLAEAFIRVTSLVDPPSALGAPWIAQRLQARQRPPEEQKTA